MIDNKQRYLWYDILYFTNNFHLYCEPKEIFISNFELNYLKEKQLFTTVISSSIYSLRIFDDRNVDLQLEFVFGTKW